MTTDWLSRANGWKCGPGISCSTLQTVEATPGTYLTLAYNVTTAQLLAFATTDELYD